MERDMNYFVLVYNRRHGVAKIKRVFTSADRTEALRYRFKLEAMHRGDTDIEIVVLGAESEADLRTTHARYFTTAVDLLERTKKAVPA
jgi:hypothetical protein